MDPDVAWLGGHRRYDVGLCSRGSCVVSPHRGSGPTADALASTRCKPGYVVLKPRSRSRSRRSRRKVAAGVAVVAVVVCASGALARGPGAGAAAVSSNVVVVTTTADVVNGDVSSVAALNAHPGRDGISLREAMRPPTTRAARRSCTSCSAPASERPDDRAHSGGLPPIYRDHLVLEGSAPNGSSRGSRSTGGGLVRFSCRSGSCGLLAVRHLRSRFAGCDSRA